MEMGEQFDNDDAVMLELFLTNRAPETPEEIDAVLRWGGMSPEDVGERFKDGIISGMIGKYGELNGKYDESQRLLDNCAKELYTAEQRIAELVAERDKWKTEYHRRIGKLEAQNADRCAENDQLCALLAELRIEWISVADRMPDEDVTVLLWAQGFAVGFYQHEQWLDETDHESMQGVTHWQPLPEPPVDYSDFVNCHEDEDDEELDDYEAEAAEYEWYD